MSGHIKFACVRFIDDKKNSFCVPINFIKVKNSEKQLIPFSPKDETDFDKNEIYFVKWLCHNLCYEDHEHNGYYRAQIGFVAEKEAVVKERMKSERTRYCSQPTDITSSDYEAVHSGETLQQLRAETGTKRKIASGTITDQVETDKGNSFLDARRPIDYSVPTTSRTEHIPHDIQDNIGVSKTIDQRKRQNSIDDSYNSDSSDVPNLYAHKCIRYGNTFLRRPICGQNNIISDSSGDSDDGHGSNANVRRRLFEEDANGRTRNTYAIPNNDDDDVPDQSEDNVSYEEETEIRNSKELKRRLIERSVNYEDSYKTHKRYEKISRNIVYLGENITVGLLSWELTKIQRKPSLFFNNMLVHIWPEKILKNRCLNERRTNYKPSDGTVKILTPQKLSLALSLYNDHLIELNVDDRKRIKNLNDSFKLISAKIIEISERNINYNIGTKQRAMKHDYKLK